ncbi:MAG: 2-C-methyl-D-erythritol 4-phosphate cytidylyltransferase [Lachnospiraceae bacterium]|nr:2-C-methyl-D-erythritol 4-phosphate cytidylyltransferase [Lachnospiraceae bacterium]
MKYSAIVTAAGRGARMGSKTPKQYLDLCGKPVIYHSLAAFEKCGVDEIIITCTPGDESFIRAEIVEKYGISCVSAIVPGGSERSISVRNGILAAGGDFVLIHDAARPLISKDLISRCMEAVERFGACVPATPVTDTVKEADSEGNALKTLDRSRLFAVQTPQCFERDLILKAYKKLEESGILASKVTDDASVVELSGLAKVKLLEGDPDNIKLTTKRDLFIAEVLKSRESV